ncbi:MAG: hypothetical protein AAF975_08865 [Spirochaetota bacterium]
MGPSPKGPEGKYGLLKWHAIAEAFALSAEAAADIAKRNKILAMIEAWFGDREYWLRTKWGQEGKDYTISPEGYFMSNVKNAHDAIKKGLSVFTLEHPEFSKIGDAVYEGYEKYDNDGGYTPITVPTNEIMQQVSGDLKTLALDAYIKIITGDLPVSAFDDFTQQFLDAGAREVLAEQNRK